MFCWGIGLWKLVFWCPLWEMCIRLQQSGLSMLSWVIFGWLCLQCCAFCLRRVCAVFTASLSSLSPTFFSVVWLPRWRYPTVFNKIPEEMQFILKFLVIVFKLTSPKYTAGAIRIALKLLSCEKPCHVNAWKLPLIPKKNELNGAGQWTTKRMPKISTNST